MKSIVNIPPISGGSLTAENTSQGNEVDNFKNRFHKKMSQKVP